MKTKVVLVHGGALSNLPLFVAAAFGFFARHGLAVEVPRLTAFSSTVGLLRSGAADIGTTGFTQALADGADEDPLRVVAGSGVLGMAVLGLPGTKARISDATFGTFADDPMQVMLYDLLAARDVPWASARRCFLPSLAEAATALREQRIDAVTMVEPWISRLQAEGFELLTDGTDLWGTPYPDTVLVARASFIQRAPEVVDATIAAMLDAQDTIAANPRAAVEAAATFYPGFSLDELQAGLLGQPPMIDIRTLSQCIAERLPTIQALGGGANVRDGAHVLDFSRLAAVLSR